MRRFREQPQECEHCGSTPVVCFGAYEAGRESFSCEGCCGHGGEDGSCYPVCPCGERATHGIEGAEPPEYRCAEHRPATSEGYPL